MSYADDRMLREAEGGGSLEPSALSPREESHTGKPPRRLDQLSWSVVRLANAVSLLAQALDEGPLRTATLAEAAVASAEAQAARFDPLKARRGTRRRAVRRTETRPGAERLDGGEALREGDLEVT